MRAAGFLLVAAFGGLPALVVGFESLALALGGSVVPWVEGFTGAVCHHDPTRTPRLGATELAVCARCSGLYVGAAFGGLLAMALPLRGWVPIRALRVACMALAVGLVAAVAESLGWVSTTNAARVSLGVLLGAPVPLIGALGGRIMAHSGRESRGQSAADQCRQAGAVTPRGVDPTRCRAR